MDGLLDEDDPLCRTGPNQLSRSGYVASSVDHVILGGLTAALSCRISLDDLRQLGNESLAAFLCGIEVRRDDTGEVRQQRPGFLS